MEGLDRHVSTWVIFCHFNSMTHFRMLTCSINTSSLLKLLQKGNAAALLSVAQDKNNENINNN